MKEIRIHGRAGQGSIAVVMSSAAAAFEDDWRCQAFPTFGSERMGAPMMAFARIADRKIWIRSQVYGPDYAIVQDPSLLLSVDVAGGVKKDGLIIVNTEKDPSALKIDMAMPIKTIDGTALATKILGRPIVNTALLGAFAGATGSIRLESINNAIRARFPGQIGEKNVEIAKKAYGIMAAS